MQKQQLDDSLIFYLASLPSSSFKAVSTIFDKFSKGTLKGQKVPRAKKGVTSKPLDLKGSNFRCLRGIPESSVEQFLLEVSNCSISLQELAIQCADVKILCKIQQGFMKVTNCATWEDATQKFPDFTTAEKLEPFKRLNFSSNTLPEQFMTFCRSAMSSTACASDSVAVDDTIFVIQQKSCLGIFWKTDIFTVDSDNMTTMLEKVMGFC